MRTSGGRPGHFGDATGIVGDRAVGVERHDDTGQRQHGGGRDGDAVEAAEADRRATIAAEITSTGSAQASIETARPWMMLVAWPVVEACATDFTGR